jgi:hypothetical protein
MGVVRAISQNRTLPQMRRFGVRLVQTGPQPVAGGQIISSDMGEEIRNAWRRKSEILGSEVRSDELPIASQLLSAKRRRIGSGSFSLHADVHPISNSYA